MVTEKYNRQEEYLTGMIKQRQEAVDDHISGRKLMNDEVSISVISLDIPYAYWWSWRIIFSYMYIFIIIKDRCSFLNSIPLPLFLYISP